LLHGDPPTRIPLILKRRSNQLVTDSEHCFRNVYLVSIHAFVVKDHTVAWW